MSYAAKALVPARRINQAGASYVSLYDPPTGKNARITELLFANPNDVGYVTLWLPTDGNIPSNSNLIASRIVVPKGVPWLFAMATMINNNQRLYGACYTTESGSSVGNVTIQVSGVEYDV